MSTCYEIDKDTIRNRAPFTIDGVRYVPERTCLPVWGEGYAKPRCSICDEPLPTTELGGLASYCVLCGARVLR